nr:flagellar regulator YcgR PilZN domain-containing protein [Methylomarinum sp. Ch1-1]MDP4519282.1 flagellar brake protein [Methylomarinum sp. Ch1-1]
MQKNRLSFDYGPKEYQNKQLLKSPKTEFRAEFDGIKVSFLGEKITKSLTKGQAAFTMPIPNALLWMQRRKFYRVKVPLAHDSYCEISFTDEDQGKQQRVRYKLLDISISGFSFLNDQPQFSHDLIPTDEFSDCTLHLNGAGDPIISFIVKNKFNISPDKPDKGQRVGCAFGNITPACESNIQRYMQTIEREQRNLL